MLAERKSPGATGPLSASRPMLDGERAPDFAIFAENGYFSEARIAV
jgi:hypothetical protein